MRGPHDHHPYPSHLSISHAHSETAHASDPCVFEVAPASFNPIASHGSIPLLFEMGKILDGIGLCFGPLNDACVTMLK
jgi:hypothetical protein